MNFDSGLTRRSLLRAGAGAGAAVAIGVRPWAAATAAAAATPGYLTRSGYAGLEGTSFTVDSAGEPVVLRLESVQDVAGARFSRALAGSEDSFALTFSGPLGSPLDSGIHTLRHAQLGNFELFASEVDEPDARRTYEIVVDRSVPEPAARSEAPAAPQAQPAERPSPDTPSTAATPAPLQPRRANEDARLALRRRRRRAMLRRLRRARRRRLKLR